MKRIFMVVAVLGLMTTGCNNGGKDGAGKDGTTKTGKDSTSNDLSAALNDLSSSKDSMIWLAQNWESKEDAQDAELAGGSTNLEMRYHGVSLFPDHSLVTNPRDNIAFGTWEVKGKDLTTTMSDGSKVQLVILMLDAKTMILGSKESKKTMEYRGEGKLQKQLSDDPFYAANNQWRIKPKKTETDEEIKKRVMACVQFYYKLLMDKAAKQSASPAIFVGLPPIFNFYDGMITVMGKDKLTDKWIACFYNKEQAVKAQVLLEDIITKKYKWNKKEPSWLKKDADVLKQIYDNLAAAK